MTELRNFREETALTASEELSLKYVSGRLGLSKSAVLRFGLLQLVDNVRRKEVLSETGVGTED